MNVDFASDETPRPSAPMKARTTPQELLAVIEALATENRSLRAEVDALTSFKQLAYRDTLTGLHNRRSFDERLEAEWARARRYGGDVSLVLVDLNDFKAINDRAGHAKGDEVLRFVAQILSTSARTCDVAFRFGGDEFALLLPDTDADGAEALMDRVVARLYAEDDCLALPPPLRLAISFGVSDAFDANSPAELFEQADEAMYESKRISKVA
ncbi:MAG: GGDEF domain-containing protein [Myxococcota bacterium]